ncbi:MAG: polysaccharide deacetylase family protein [Clostridium sp.]
MKNNISKSIIMSFLIIFAFQFFTITCTADDSTNVEKIVYLTFDDGPGGTVTTKVLDILKDEGVPATFFVIGCQIPNQENIILRMKNEGHSIGLHSITHDRNKLYNGNQGFIDEMLKEQKILEEITGEKYNILRFPFGCNNSTYRLTNSLVNLIHENNLKIYDWTQDSGDGANSNAAPDYIFKKSINKADKVIVLMHCSYINKNTALALPSIIKYYKNAGYTFKVIDDKTPEIYKITKSNN